MTVYDHHDDVASAKLHGDFGTELRDYFIGFVAAVVLTALSFAAAIFQPGGQVGAFASLAVLAVVQVVVQFRYFLHIDFSPANRMNLYFLIFTLVIIAMMVAGTVWVLANLMMRMM